MKSRNNLLLFTSPSTHPTKKLRTTVSLALRQRHLYGKPRRNNTGKELDSETGLYYFGARYLDPKTSRWLSGDPALGEYLPSAPVSDEARKRNGSLPGMGGVFNYVNLHVYHYAGNNPVVYRDPDGKEIRVQIHRAFHITPFYHASIRITLDNPILTNAFQNDERVVTETTGWRTDNNGNLYITIGGEAIGGLLHGIINRGTDVQEANKNGFYLITGVDEITAIEGILRSYVSYNNDLNYDLFPGLGDGYNSNSYISGILNNAGLPRYDFEKKNMPGWDKPIPIP